MSDEPSTYQDLVITWDCDEDGGNLKVAAEWLNEKRISAQWKPREQPIFSLLPSAALTPPAGYERLQAAIRALMPGIELAAYGEGTGQPLERFLETAAQGVGAAPDEASESAGNDPSEGDVPENAAAAETTRLSKPIGSAVATKKRVRLDELGQELYASVFERSGLDVWYKGKHAVAVAAGHTVRVRIELDLLGRGRKQEIHRQLARLPWECLRPGDANDGVEFWGARRRSPVIRDIESDSFATGARIQGRLRVLLVSANPPGTKALKLTDELNVIERIVEELGGSVEFVHIPQATYADVKTRLEEEFHVLHFMGHGGYDEKGGCLLLHTNPGAENDKADRVGINKWKTAFDGGKESLRLIFINACNTAAEGENQGAAAETEALGGLATSILHVGIPAVVAMQFEIGDNAAITFAQEFYKWIAEYRPLEEAVSRARQAVFLQEVDSDEDSLRRDGGSNFWLTPVLYMRYGTDGVLLAAEAETEPKPETEREPKPEPGPKPGPPPEDIDVGQPYVLWFTEHQGKLVVNWRIRGTWEHGDRVALYDEPPADEWGVFRGNVRVANDKAEQDPDETRLFATALDHEPDKYYIAYYRERDDGGGVEILATSPETDPA